MINIDLLRMIRRMDRSARRMSLSQPFRKSATPKSLSNNSQFLQTNSDSLLLINVAVNDDLDGDSQRSVVTKIRRDRFRGWMDVPPVTTSTSSDLTTSTTSDHYPEASGGFRN
jgi:hypothetical protein